MNFLRISTVLVKQGFLSILISIITVMKKILAIALILTIVSILPVSASIEHKVIKVIDGDTVYVDFNNNGIPEQNEKVRINGIDTFETKLNDGLEWQMKLYGLSQDEALGLGYYGKEFAKKELLNKSVKAEYTAGEKFDKNNRHLMSIYYDCNRHGKCKNYEQEVLKTGLATIYTKSNLADELKTYQSLDKIKAYAEKSHSLNLVVLNKKNGKYHKLDCKYGCMASQQDLIDKPLITYSTASCCYPKGIKQKKYKPYKNIVKPDAKDGNIELYFLSPLKQKHPENNCKSSACKALLYNIDNAKESIDFAIYGIAEQDRIFEALVNAQKRGIELKIIIDETSVKGKYVNVDYIKQNGIDLKIENWAGKMHMKSIIIDDDILVIGSMNFTKQGEKMNDENCVVIKNSQILNSAYKKIFFKLWNSIK